MAAKFLTDTDRLNFLLKYFCIDDVGDEEYCPGVIIRNEDLEDVLTWGTPPGAGVRRNQCDTDDLRRIIDISIRKQENEA